MRCLITDKTLKSLKTLQDNLEEGLVSKKTAALSLKYAIEDIEAKELTILDEFSGNDGKARVMTATYEAGGGQ